MGRSVSPQKLSGQLLAEPLSVAADGQPLAARTMQSLPLVNSWLFQGMTDAVEAHEAMFRSNTDIYQQGVDLDVRLQALKSAFGSLLQVGVTQFGGGVGDKMQRLFDQLGQLRSDYAAVQEQLKMQSDFETHYLQQLSERTELLWTVDGGCDGVRGGRGLQVEPEVAVARVQPGLVECSPKMDEAGEWVESEIVPVVQQRSASKPICVTDASVTDASVTDESYVQTFGESLLNGAMLQELPEHDHGMGGEAQHSPGECLQSDFLHADRASSELSQRQGVSGDEEPNESYGLSGAPLQHEVKHSEIQYTGAVAQKVSELMVDCGELYEQVEHLSAGTESESFELEDKIANLSRRCNELRGLVADFNSRLETQVTSLGKRDLQGSDSGDADQQGDSGAVSEGEINGLLEDLQNLSLQIDSAVSVNLEAEEQFRKMQGESGLSDEAVQEPCNIKDIKVQHKLLGIESGFLSIDNTILEDLQNLSLQIDSAVSVNLEAEEQFRKMQGESGLSDEAVKELCNSKVQHKLLGIESEFLSIGNRILTTSRDALVQQMTLEFERQKREFQMQLCAANERVDELRDLVKTHKNLLERKDGLLAANESVMVDYDVQLRAITAVAEKLAASFAYLDSKNDETSRVLAMGCEQLSGAMVKTRKLAEMTTASPDAARELLAELEEIDGEITGLTQDVNDVQRELDSVKTFLHQNSEDFLSESSAADESDVARTIVSLGRRSVEI